MKKKVIIGACAVVAIALFSTAYICNINSDSKASKDNSANASFNTANSVKANFSEMRLSDAELIKQSDLVVRCIFKGEKETKERTHEVTGGDGKEQSLTALVTTYKMKLVETLKGSVNKNFDVVTFGGGNEYLETGDEYLLFLHYNKTEDTYTLVSYGQGLNIVKQKENSSKKNITEADSLDDAIEIKSAETKVEVMNYKELKQKIKELDK